MTVMATARPRGASAPPGRFSDPDDSASQHDAFSDTLVQRAISRRAPDPVGIVVTGDNHLSAALAGFSPKRRAERRERLRRGFAAAVDYALQHGARLFVIAGDLFDSPTPANADRAFVASQLARLRRADIACVAVGGNHDSPRGVTGQVGEAPHQTYAALEGMLYFPATALLTPRLLTLGALRLAVAGLSTDAAVPRGSDPLAGIAVADPEHVVRQADLGLLIVHAGIEGFARPEEDERIVSRASLEALPPTFRVVVAGHAHRFGRARVGEREIIVPGSTERMDFAAPPASSGFAWLELTSDGLTRVRRLTVAEQPRADIELTTARLFPISAAHSAHSVDDPAEISGVTALGPGTVRPLVPTVPVVPVPPLDDRLVEARAESVGPGGAGGMPNGAYGGDDTRAARAQSERRRAADALLATIREAIDEVSTDETLVRLRLVGPITRVQYHRLPLREALRYGTQRAFAFELDTSGLEVLEPASAGVYGGAAGTSASGSRRAATTTGPLSPAFEVERLLQDRLARVAPNDDATVADLHAAASLLLARLRATGAPDATGDISRDREAEL